MKTSYSIVLLPGDGIGPEVTAGARLVLESVASRFKLAFDFSEFDFGGIAIDRWGTPLPEATLSACMSAQGVLMGAIGGPKWDALKGEERPEAGLLALRAELGVFANLRPVSVPASLAHLSVLPPAKVEGVDILVVRELTGGIYFGKPRILEADYALDTMRYTVAEIERITRVACRWSESRSGRVTSVDKANVLAGLFPLFDKNPASRIVRDEFPGVQLDHMYVDNAAMQLVLNPRQFDVILTGNLFGDILSDLASTLAGSLGLLPSACLGGITPLFEPVHGSAPDIAGLNQANPVAAILSAAMMLDEWGQNEAAQCVRDAVEFVLESGLKTADLATEKEETTSTSAFVSQVVTHIERAKNTN
jgi:3-isopropylmalate dehydrogenase